MSDEHGLIPLSKLIDQYVSMLREENSGPLRMKDYPDVEPFSEGFWSSLSIRLSNHGQAGILKFHGQRLDSSGLMPGPVEQVPKELFSALRVFSRSTIDGLHAMAKRTRVHADESARYTGVLVEKKGIKHFLEHHARTTREVSHLSQP